MANKNNIWYDEIWRYSPMKVITDLMVEDRKKQEVKTERKKQKQVKCAGCWEMCPENRVEYFNDGMGGKIALCEICLDKINYDKIYEE